MDIEPSLAASIPTCNQRAIYIWVPILPVRRWTLIRKWKDTVMSCRISHNIIRNFLRFTTQGAVTDHNADTSEGVTRSRIHAAQAPAFCSILTGHPRALRYPCRSSNRRDEWLVSGVSSAAEIWTQGCHGSSQRWGLLPATSISTISEEARSATRYYLLMFFLYRSVICHVEYISSILTRD